MSGSTWGERLRSRARELNLTDAEVARRVDIPQRRYSNYVNMRREPNFTELLKICRALGCTPNEILGVESTPPADDASRRASLALTRMTPSDQEIALVVLDAIAGRETPRPKRGRKPSVGRR